MFVKGKVYTSGSYDDFTEHGHYVCSNTVNNAPVSEGWFSLTVFKSTADNDIIQLAHALSSKTWAWRTYSNQAWSGWRVENLSNLTTTSKDSLVDAVNEVNGRIYQKMLGTSLLEYAQTCAYGFSTVYLTGASYGGSDLPGSNYAYGSAMILKRADTAINVVLFPESSYFKVAINSYNGSWSGWKDFAGNSIT